MNILIGKIGKSIKFNNLNISTGDDSPAIFYSTLSRMLPEHTLYFVGPNNINSLPKDYYDMLFPNHNVLSIYEKPYYYDNDPEAYNFDSIIDKINEKNIHIDFALIFQGFCGTTCLSNCLINKKTGNYLLSLGAFKKYAGPYVHVLNKLGCPFYTLCEDARYIITAAKELFNKERIVFTQCSERRVQSRYKHIASYNNLDTMDYYDAECRYASIEKIFLMALDKNWRDAIDVDKKLNNTTYPKCIVLSHGHGTKRLNCGVVEKDARLNEYKKYIIDGLKNTEFSDTCIYGKWEKETYEKYENIKGNSLLDLNDEISNAKYTFIYSIVPGFVTIKPWEMITLGLIPFLHKDYDPDRLLGLPEFVYTSSVNDFIEKMRTLENDNEMYKNLLNECLSYIKPEYLDGSYVINTVMNDIYKDMGLEYTDRKGVEPVLNHFGK